MSTSSIASTIENNWHTFLMHVELAKNYKIANMASAIGLPAPNPLLESLLPSLLYIRLGSLLDESLREYIAANGFTAPRQYRDDFNGRINFLDDLGHLSNAGELHSLRLRRNALAHRASNFCSWSDLEDSIMIADHVLQHLGFVGSRPLYEFYAERSPVEPPEEGYAMTFAHCYGLKAGDRKVMEVSWKSNIAKE